ncbi:MAG: PEP-CTERM sorting domain-containing protein [Lentisphaeria bacterium]|nr:PEP-CTERM sorting domain-containing protein [Lentisphaeria bacterium]
MSENPGFDHSHVTEERLYLGAKGSVTHVGSNAGGQALSNTLLLFKDDDVSITRENYPLTVSAVWIGDTVLSQAEIKGIESIPEPVGFVLFALAVGTVFFRRRKRC